MKQNQTPQLTQEQALKAKNEAVKKAFFAALTEIKTLIKSYPTDYLRTYLEVDYEGIFKDQYGFYSPLLHLRFEEVKGECSIYFARNYSFKQQVGLFLDSLLARCIYKHTAIANTTVNIEDTLNISLFRIDDYMEAKSLLDRGFKGCQKVTVEAA